jgi:glycosyltransferase involved in cell wall biosynthesis
VALALAALPERTVQVKIAALAPFPFVGFEYGGAERIHNLLTRVQHQLDVFVPNYGDIQYAQYHNLNLHYVHVPESMRNEEYDMVISKNSKELFAAQLTEFNPDLVILEHPWQADALSGQRFVYDAHNNETAMKSALGKESMVEETRRVEGLALQAQHITFCSVDDNLQSDAPMTLIPNGTDIPEINRHHGFGSNVVLFVGSAHPPNIGAALTLTTIAKALPQYHFVIAGACGNNLRPDSDNVTVLGHIDAKMLDYLMRTAHVFMNPIAAGAGTSLKVARALSYALPVISSSIGARGYTDACIITDTTQEAFNALDALRDPKNYAEAADRSRTAAYEYSWDSVGKKFNDVIQQVLDDRG